MLRNVVCIVVAAAVSLGLALAQDQGQKGGVGGKGQPTWGKVMKLEGNKLTLQQYDPKTKQFGKSRELTVSADDLKAYQMGKDNKQTAIKGGLKGDPFQNIGKEGLYVRLGMKGENINQIYLYENQKAFNQGIQNFPGSGGSKEGAKDGKEKQ